MDAQTWETATEWLELWHAIPWNDRTERRRRLIANGVCRRFAHLLTDPRLTRMVDLSDEVADGRIKGKRWDEWERARSDAYAAEDSAKQALTQAAALAVAGLGTDNHKVGRAIETATDVFGYQAAVRRRLMRPTSRVRTGRNLWKHPVFVTGRDEDGARVICEVIREVVWNPFRKVKLHPSWRTDTAVSLARQMYEARDFGAMPILADALQDAGCEHPDVLAHCRDPQVVHVRGCWVVDLVVGKS